MAFNTRALAQLVPIVLAALPAAAQNSLQSLGAGPGPTATGMSADTTQVAGVGQGSVHVWDSTSGVWNSLGGGTSSSYPKLSSDGSFVTFDEIDPNTNLSYAARWSQSSSWQLLPGLGSSSGTSASSAKDISGDGQTVCGFAWLTPGQGHAFKWTPAGGTVNVDTTLGTSSNCNAISLDGSTIVGWDADGGSQRDACIWKNGVATMLGSLEPSNPVFGSGECHGVSSNGGWVCGTSFQHAFRWSQATGLIDMGQVTAGVRLTATAIADDGTTVVGWSGSSNLDAQAFIWRPEYGNQPLNLRSLLISLGVPGASNWARLAMAVDISPDGSAFAGWGQGPGGLLEGFLVRLPRVPMVYCTSGTTTNNCAASISASGNPNITHSAPCTISITNVEGQKTGIVFYGLASVATPWCSMGGGTSFLCVKSPTMRTGVQSSGGANFACNGVLSLNWNAFQTATPGALGAPWVGGEKAYVQGWFRDPPSCKTTSLSNAVALTYLP